MSNDDIIVIGAIAIAGISLLGGTAIFNSRPSDYEILANQKNIAPSNMTPIVNKEVNYFDDSMIDLRRRNSDGTITTFSIEKDQLSAPELRAIAMNNYTISESGTLSTGFGALIKGIFGMGG
jgi:hypothetical protein